MSHRRPAVSVLFTSLLLAACDSASAPVAPPPPAPPAAASVVARGGDGQRATILAALHDSLVVSVADQRGLPMPGATVEWSVDEGGGALSATRTVADAQGRAAVRWVFGVTPGVHHARARVGELAPAIFSDTAASAACPIPDDLSPDFHPLTRTRARLRSGANVTIVAIGSSSTAGYGASSSTMTYPAQLARMLAARYPAQTIDVINAGIGGQSAADMVNRFDRDVFARSPDLVIWQTGTIDAMSAVTLADFLATLRAGTDRVRAHGVDLLFLDSQYAPAAVGDTVRYVQFQDAMAAFAHDAGAPLARRYALMHRYVDVGLYPLRDLLWTDSFHPSDLTYRCVAEYIAAGLTAE